MEQTAVEFLKEKLNQYVNWEHSSDAYAKRYTLKDLYNDFEQAKAMEKEQKIKFAEHCLNKALDLDIRTAFSNVEQYYKETFKSE